MKETIELNGLTFAVRHEFDRDMGAPWTEHDGHGIVSDWTTRSKTPGERVLSSDHGSKRYYDFAGTVKRAIADGWGIANPPDGLTKRQIAAMAVEKDFEHLQAWCEDRWSWIGVIVTLLDVDGEPTNETESLWGIESNAGDYLDTVAGELASEIANRIGESDMLCVRVRRTEEQETE